MMERKLPKACIIAVLVTLISLGFLYVNLKGCRADKSKTNQTAGQKRSLNILTLGRIRSTDFFRHINPAFEQNFQCKVNMSAAIDYAEIQEIIGSEKKLRKYDLVLGLDNGFLYGNDITEVFTETDIPKKQLINKIYLPEKTGRFIPYGYAYLAVLYNEAKITVPPESFGELQDARFLNQVVVLNPQTSGIGRAMLLWTTALFGNDGYQQFWRSIKKNVFAVRDNLHEALQTMQTQDCSITFGLSSTPAWITETQPNPLPINLSMLKEGSFLYTESAAIPRKSDNKALAEAYLLYLLSPEVQKFVALDLGLFPTNDFTPLPVSFTTSPFSSYSVNDKLQQENPRDNIDPWLDFWSSLFPGKIF